MSTQEAALYLDRTPARVLQLIQDGSIKTLGRISERGAYLISRDSVMQYSENKRKQVVK